MSEEPPNPYQSPREAEIVSPLTPFERATLEYYEQYHRQPPTLADLLWRQFGGWAFTTVLCIVFFFALALLFHFLGHGADPLALQNAGLLVLGFLGGIIVRDLTICRQFLLLWPLLDDLLHWPRLAERLRGP